MLLLQVCSSTTEDHPQTASIPCPYLTYLTQLIACVILAGIHLPRGRIRVPPVGVRVPVDRRQRPQRPQPEQPFRRHVGKHGHTVQYRE